MDDDRRTGAMAGAIITALLFGAFATCDDPGTFAEFTKGAAIGSIVGGLAGAALNPLIASAIFVGFFFIMRAVFLSEASDQGLLDVSVGRVAIFAVVGAVVGLVACLWAEESGDD